MTTEAAAKKDIQKLQRAIVDGLEDVKAQDIQVFDTEHLSPLFERVILASGTSNRQTKALATSVRDAVREAGFNKPRVEGETNGEWIIVDCGQAVAHIMQPAIRRYYHLEEIWGEKPVRTRLGAAKPAASAKAAADEGTPAAKAPTSLRRASAAKTAIRAAEKAAKADAAAAKPAGRGAGGTAGKTRVGAAAGKTGAKTAGKTSARTAGTQSGGARTPVPTVVVNKAPARKAAAKSSLGKAGAGNAASGKASSAKAGSAKASSARKAAPASKTARKTAART